MSRSTPETLVLLCGLLCDETVWRPVADRLGDVAVPTILSFPDFDSIRAMARHVLDRAPGRVALAGHSMGGRVALEVARRAPERVSRLALLNTGVHPTKAHEAETRGRLVTLAREEGMAALASAWLPPMLGCGAEDAALVGALTAMIERQTAESFARQIAALLKRPDARPALAGVAVPILLISAARDNWSPVSQHEAMRALAPSARLVAIPEAGHMAPIEAPKAIADALRVWLAG